VKITTLALLLCLCAPAGYAAAKKDDLPPPATSIAELQRQLEQVLKEQHVPGVSIAIVHRDGPEWVAGLGLADVASGRAATAETLFRIGSTSKAFAGFAILKLAGEGKLKLDDKVHALVPDVWFDNPWEATDPVRVVDLLEHTTGWDDMHLREYFKSGDGMTLTEGLDYDHRSRTSRWRPGTRMSYCNSGPAVAGAIVEKLTGRRFEDYISENFFLPIGMQTATYMPPTTTPATTLYHDDGKTPFKYWHVLLRPAGSINASAKDMAAYVQFYLNRGTVGSTEVLPAAALGRAETPTRTWAAQQGLKTGYAVYNYTSIQDGFVYHGHNGGVDGGLTEVSYLPEAGVGYSYSINSGNGEAYERIGKLIRAYITRGLTPPVPPAPAALPAGAEEYSGWYVTGSPRNEVGHFFERLFLTHASVANGKVQLTGLNFKPETFLPVGGAQLRHVGAEGRPDPVASMQLLAPGPEGRFIAVGGGMGTLKQVPGWLALTQIVAVAWLVLAIAAIVLYAPFWLLAGVSPRRRRPAERPLRLWPLAAVASLALFAGAFAAADDMINALGAMTVYSAALCLATVLFALATLGSTVAILRTPPADVRRAVRVHAIAVTVPLVVATVYLLWWGVIGLRTWA
jgi:CubicO group peptidase (beta-lactamase class C family)